MDASWEAWSPWSGCTKPCNGGSFERRRLCKKALYGGNPVCPGENIDKSPCNAMACNGKEKESCMIFLHAFQLNFFFFYVSACSKNISWIFSQNLFVSNS